MLLSVYLYLIFLYVRKKGVKLFLKIYTHVLVLLYCSVFVQVHIAF